MKYMYMCVSCIKISIVTCYIKNSLYKYLSSRLVRLTVLMRFFMIVTNDLDDRINLSSLDQMTGPRPSLYVALQSNLIQTNLIPIKFVVPST